MGSTAPPWLPLAIAFAGFLAGAWWVVRGLRGTPGAGRRPGPALDPELARLVEQLPEGALQRLGRTAFTIRTRVGEPREGDPLSRFGGRPWLPNGQAWPACERCGQALKLLLQLDLDDLPPGGPPQRSGGLAQLFHCFSESCGGRCKNGPSSDPPYLARVVDTRLPGAPAEHPLADGQAVQASTILDWEPRLELPGRAEHGALGAELAGALERLADDRLQPAAADKLGGWPHWSGPPRPALCPTCGGPMELLFQLDADGCLDLGAGADQPVGHLTRCPTHSSDLAFAWSRPADHFGGVVPST